MRRYINLYVAGSGAMLVWYVGVIANLSTYLSDQHNVNRSVEMENYLRGSLQCMFEFDKCQESTKYQREINYIRCSGTLDKAQFIRIYAQCVQSVAAMCAKMAHDMSEIPQIEGSGDFSFYIDAVVLGVVGILILNTCLYYLEKTILNININRYVNRYISALASASAIFVWYVGLVVHLSTYLSDQDSVDRSVKMKYYRAGYANCTLAFNKCQENTAYQGAIDHIRCSGIPDIAQFLLTTYTQCTQSVMGIKIRDVWSEMPQIEESGNFAFYNIYAPFYVCASAWGLGTIGAISILIDGFNYFEQILKHRRHAERRHHRHRAVVVEQDRDGDDARALSP